MDDAELDSMPTRVIKPEERAALPKPKARSAPPPPAPASVAQGKLPPPPAPVSVAQGKLPPPPAAVSVGPHLPPPPRPASFRPTIPTQPASYRVADSQPPSSAALGSVPPIALSQPPPPVELPMRRIPRAAIAAASVAAAALLAVGLLGAKSAIFSSPGGSLVATVAGVAGQPVKGVSVFVDGKRRCESSPCRVDDLGIGSHFVRVTAPGYISTAAQAVAVHSGQDAVMRLDLSPLKPAKADATAKQDKDDKADNSKSDDQGAVQASSLPAAPEHTASSAPVSRHHYAYHARTAPAHHSAPPAPAPAAPSGKGVLILSSTPATNVVVDGHPLGSTPKAVRVPAGTHTVVFAGEAGRAVRAINVKPDDRLNVAVRF